MSQEHVCTFIVSSRVIILRAARGYDCLPALPPVAWDSLVSSVDLQLSSQLTHHRSHHVAYLLPSTIRYASSRHHRSVRQHMQHQLDLRSWPVEDAHSVKVWVCVICVELGTWKRFCCCVTTP